MVSDVCLCLAEKDVTIIPKPRAKAAAKKVTKPVMVLILLYQCACQYEFSGSLDHKHCCLSNGDATEPEAFFRQGVS